MSLVDDPEFIRLKVSGRLPAPKGIALEVIKLTQQADVSSQAIAHTIGADAALSMRVIKAANVLLANSSRPVITIADAVMVLGLRGLRQLVLSIALVADYRHGPCKQFDYQHFWTHSLLTGIAARRLVEHGSLAAADEIFVVGLFSHIGQLALTTLFAEEYGQLLLHGKEQPVSLMQLQQREKFGFDESELSEAMLAEMHFPPIFQALVRNCDQPGLCTADEASREWRLLQLLHMAKLLAELFLAGSAANGERVTDLRHLAARLPIEWEDLIEIGDACARDWQEWSALLNMGSQLNLLPLTELLNTVEQSEEKAMTVEAAIEPGTYPLRVLVVEDDSVMLKLLEAMLRTAGHTVRLARNGVEALRLIEQEPPQLLISDWMMPEMDGITLCRKLREHSEWRNVYMIILTGQESSDRLVEAFEAGADDYLVKPIISKIFFARLRGAQRIIQTQQELAFDREQLQRVSNDLIAANRHLKSLALTDSLTGLPNRRAAMERLEQEWLRTRRGSHPLACMMVDIDHFKLVNDKFGHPVGDLALKCIAQSLRQVARAQDVVCRMGGEEFLVICPDADIHAAYQCAERLRQHVAALTVDHVNPPLRLTISIGISEVRSEMTTLDELLVRADNCLYAAKQAGRNRIVIDE